MPENYPILKIPIQLFLEIQQRYFLSSAKIPLNQTLNISIFYLSWQKYYFPEVTKKNVQDLMTIINTVRGPKLLFE